MGTRQVSGPPDPGRHTAKMPVWVTVSARWSAAISPQPGWMIHTHVTPRQLLRHAGMENYVGHTKAEIDAVD